MFEHKPGCLFPIWGFRLDWCRLVGTMVEVDAPASPSEAACGYQILHWMLDVGQDMYKFHQILQVTYCIILYSLDIHWTFHRMWDILFGWTCSYHVHLYGTYSKHNHQVWWDAVIKNQPGLARAVGIGMNADELARNEQLTEWTVKDLNKAPLSQLSPRFWRQQLAVSHGYKML